MSNRVNTSSGITTSAVATRANITFSPASPPSTMTIHGRSPPIGDFFRPDLPIFPSSFVIGENKYLHYHAIVWTKLFGQDIPDYGCVYSNGDGLRLGFNSKSSLQKFERWMLRYERTFFGDGSMGECYAASPKNGPMKGYFVEDRPDPTYGSLGTIGNIGSVGVASAGSAGIMGSAGITGIQTYIHTKSNETISEIFMPDWVNIVRHSTKSVLRMTNGWFFASAKDGIMFRMQQDA